MTKKINKILAKYFKISIHKTGETLLLPENKNWKNNLVIEFYGASGVGKTTLYFHYIKNHNFSFKHSLINRKTLLKKAINTEFEDLGIFDDGFTSRISYKLENKKFSSLHKLRMYENTYLLAVWNYIASYIIENKTIILDENDMFFPFLFLLQKKETKEIGKQYFQNKIIIYCYLEEEELVRRLKERVAAGTHPYLQKRNFNDEQIKTMAIKTLKNRKRGVKELEKYGITILKVNTADSLDENTKKIDSYIAQAIKKGKVKV